MNNLINFLRWGRRCAAVLILAVAFLQWPAQSQAQDTPVFHTVFEYLTGVEDPPLPILKRFGVATGNLDTFDGSSTMDSYGGFERYDDGRLIIGVRENGIDENDPGHDAAMAAAFPDRSLVWIDDSTGAPTGVALVVGPAPAPLDQEFLDAGGTVADYYFNFGVDDAGVIYVGYKNLILRYAPNAAGDGFDGPTTAYKRENDFSDRWHQWRWENFRVSGSGADTVLIAGGKTWRPSQQTYIFSTGDGVTYEVEGIANFPGGNSRIIDGPFEGEEWMFGSRYPGGDSGLDVKIQVAIRDKDFGGDFTVGGFTADPDFEGDYTPKFVSDTDSHSDFPFVVSYTTPSWNSVAVGVDPLEPGYIAVHDLEGIFMLAHQLDITEESELVEEYVSTQFHGTLGKVEVNVHPDAPEDTAEILWLSGIYGYGRYLYGTDEDPWGSPPPPFEVIEITLSGTTVEITVPSRPGQVFLVEQSGDLSTWVELADGIDADPVGDSTTITVEGAPPGSSYYRVERE